MVRRGLDILVWIREVSLKTVLRVIIAIAFSNFFGHVVMAEDMTLRVISLKERLEALRAGIKEGGYLACGEIGGPLKIVRYENCAEFHSLDDNNCFGDTTAAMVDAQGYDRMCDEVQFLQTARPPTVEYFNVDSPNWWKSIPASITPGALVWTESPETFDRSAKWELLKNKLLGDFEKSEGYFDRGVVRLILDKWKDKEESEGYNCGEHRDLFVMRLGVLADFDGDGVGEVRIHGYQIYESDCLGGSMDALLPGFGITLKKASPDSPIQRMWTDSRFR